MTMFITFIILPLILVSFLILERLGSENSNNQTKRLNSQLHNLTKEVLKDKITSGFEVGFIKRRYTFRSVVDIYILDDLLIVTNRKRLPTWAGLTLPPFGISSNPEAWKNRLGLTDIFRPEQIKFKHYKPELEIRFVDPKIFKTKVSFYIQLKDKEEYVMLERVKGW